MAPGVLAAYAFSSASVTGLQAHRVEGVQRVVAGVGVRVAGPARTRDRVERVDGEEAAAGRVVDPRAQPLQAADVSSPAGPIPTPAGRPGRSVDGAHGPRVRRRAVRERAVRQPGAVHGGPTPVTGPAASTGTSPACTGVGAVRRRGVPEHLGVVDRAELGRARPRARRCAGCRGRRRSVTPLSQPVRLHSSSRVRPVLAGDRVRRPTAS